MASDRRERRSERPHDRYVLTGALRTAILTAAGSPTVHAIVRRYGMRLGARRFVPGEGEEAFFPAVQAANDAGFAVAATILGEGVRDNAQARAVAERYCRLLHDFQQRALDADVALKLTHLGLDLDPQLAFENAERVVEAAHATGNFIRFDMEQSRYVDATLDIYRRLRERRTCVGFVLQSYLKRTPADLDVLLRLQPNVRIVKGAYLESPAIAYERKSDVDAAYVALAERALAAGAYAAIATHDRTIVRRLEHRAAAMGLPKTGRFEFQLLYGIGTPLAEKLRDKGYRVRLAIPFGEDWFPYLMRRLAERPANLGFFLANLLPWPPRTR